MRTSQRTSPTDNDENERRCGSRRDAEGHAAALVVIIDDIERIEELHGAAGLADVLLIAGQRIRATLRTDDFTARWGGEELVVILREADIDAAAEVGQRIRMAISQPLAVVDGRSFVPSCSIGCATGDPDRVDALVGRASQALELAKASGGNCVRRALPVADRWTAGVAAGR